MSLIALTRSLRLYDRTSESRRSIAEERSSDRTAKFQAALDFYLSEYRQHHAESAEAAKQGYKRFVFIQWLWR
jgi:hypothetical protein